MFRGVSQVVCLFLLLTSAFCTDCKMAKNSDSIVAVCVAGTETEM